MFSCMLLCIVENISLQSILHKYDLCWHFFTTYFEVIVTATLGKSSRYKWYLNEAMAVREWRVESRTSAR